MPHLKHIGLTNFRVFGERTNIALAPLTILTGTNSSGKSSVLKAMQLLQENIADIGHLNFSHGEHKLGNFDMALNREATNKTMMFTLPFELRFDRDNIGDLYADFAYELDESNNLKFGKLTHISICLEKNKQEIIGITPLESININFEYFHRKRILNYNLDLLKYYRYAFDIYNMQDMPKNIEELRSQSTDFITYSKPAIHLVKQIYESNDATQKEKLLHFFELEFPKDFDLFWVCEKYMIASFEKPEFDKDSSYINQIMTIDSFMLSLPEAILKHQIWLSYNLFAFEGKAWKRHLMNKAYDEIQSQTEFIDYVYSNILSIKERLKSKYAFDNSQEFMNLIFDYVFKSEQDRLENVVSGLKNHLKISEDHGGGKPNLSAFLHSFKSYPFLNLIDSEENIFKNAFDILFKEDKYDILCRKIFGGNLDIFEKANGIYPKVEKILNNTLGFISTFKNDNFYYLEAVRANTQRIYTFQSQGTSFNQLVLDLIKKDDELPILFINSWLEKLGIAKELKVEVNSQGVGVTISVDGQSLADMGYGITQLLPILIRLATITDYKWQAPDPENANGWGYYGKRILYIEEPETNLHPKLQSKLADILVEACQTFNLQIIVETHSEYLIRKLQYLTAKKDITPQMTVIHYFYDPKEERPEGEPQVKQINIQTDGRLTGQFGAGFYDETARLMTAILTGETLN